MKTFSRTENCCVSCQIRDGIPTVSGHVWGYYASRGGVRALIVECNANSRIRINDAVEVVVMGTGNGKVQLGIINAADSDA